MRLWKKPWNCCSTRNVNAVIHCGDIDDAETVWLFQGFTAHFVFGNCDKDKHAIRQAAPRNWCDLVHEPFGYTGAEQG